MSADRPTCLHQGWELEAGHWVKREPCGKPATKVVTGTGRAPWHGCGKHAPEMAKALSVGSQGDYSATTKDWRP